MSQEKGCDDSNILSSLSQVSSLSLMKSGQKGPGDNLSSVSRMSSFRESRLSTDVSSLEGHSARSAKHRTSKLIVRTGNALKKLESILMPVEKFHEVLDEMVHLHDRYGSILTNTRLNVILHVLRSSHQRKVYFVDPKIYSLKQAFQCELMRCVFGRLDAVPYVTPELFVVVEESSVGGGSAPWRLDRNQMSQLAAKEKFREGLLKESERYKEYILQIESYQLCDNFEYHEMEVIQVCPICGVFRQNGKDHFKMKIFTSTEFLYPTSYAEKEVWKAARKTQKKIKQTTQEIFQIEAALEVQASNVIKFWWGYRYLYRFFRRKEQTVRVSREDYTQRKWRSEEKRLYKEQLKQQQMMAHLASFDTSVSTLESVSIIPDQFSNPEQYSSAAQSFIEGSIQASEHSSARTFLNSSISSAGSLEREEEEIPERTFKETHELYKDMVNKLESKQKQMDGNQRHAMVRRQLDRNKELRRFYLKKRAEGIENPRYPVKTLPPKPTFTKRSKLMMTKKLPSLEYYPEENKYSPTSSIQEPLAAEEPESSPDSEATSSRHSVENGTEKAEQNQPIDFENFRTAGSSVASNADPPENDDDDDSHWTKTSSGSHWVRSGSHSRVNSGQNFHSLSVRMDSLSREPSSVINERLSGASCSSVAGSLKSLHHTDTSEDKEFLEVMSRVPGTMIQEMNRDALDQELPFLKFKSSAHLPKDAVLQKVVLNTGMNRIGHGLECNVKFDPSVVDKVHCIINVERRGSQAQDMKVKIKDNSSSRGTFILNGSGLVPVPGINSEGYTLKVFDNVVFSRSAKSKTLFELIYEFHLPPQKHFLLSKNDM
mmetsp:Transcript_28510/g.37295  ORF Transcript_28510/g.37295 Transcript_28510/m.37295 type:complete len:827 (+) Transcript_28510:83-2563(+)